MTRRATRPRPAPFPFVLSSNTHNHSIKFDYDRTAAGRLNNPWTSSHKWKYCASPLALDAVVFAMRVMFPFIFFALGGLLAPVSEAARSLVTVAIVASGATSLRQAAGRVWELIRQRASEYSSCCCSTVGVLLDCCVCPFRALVCILDPIGCIAWCIPPSLFFVCMAIAEGFGHGTSGAMSFVSSFIFSPFILLIGLDGAVLLLSSLYFLFFATLLKPLVWCALFVAYIRWANRGRTPDEAAHFVNSSTIGAYYHSMHAASQENAREIAALLESGTDKQVEEECGRLREAIKRAVGTASKLHKELSGFVPDLLAVFSGSGAGREMESWKEGLLEGVTLADSFLLQSCNTDTSTGANIRWYRQAIVHYKSVVHAEIAFNRLWSLRVGSTRADLATRPEKPNDDRSTASLLISSMISLLTSYMIPVQLLFLFHIAVYIGFPSLYGRFVENLCAE